MQCSVKITATKWLNKADPRGQPTRSIVSSSLSGMAALHFFMSSTIECHRQRVSSIKMPPFRFNGPSLLADWQAVVLLKTIRAMNIAGHGWSFGSDRKIIQEFQKDDQSKPGWSISDHSLVFQIILNLDDYLDEFGLIRSQSGDRSQSTCMQRSRDDLG